MLKKMKIFGLRVIPKTKKVRVIFLVGLFAIICALTVLAVSFFFSEKNNQNSQDLDDPRAQRSFTQTDPEQNIALFKNSYNSTENIDEKIDYLYSIASRYQQKKQYDQALEQLNLIASLREPDFYLNEMYGDIYTLNGDEATAEDYYKKAIEQVRQVDGADVEKYQKSIEAKKRFLKGEKNDSGGIPG